MKRISYQQVADWCRGNGYGLRDWIPFVPAAAQKFGCAVPVDPQQVPMFCDAIANLGPPHAERLLWIRDWTIWSERSQAIGLRMLDLLVAQVSSSEKALDSHAYLATAEEWCDVVALLTVPILFGWDAHLFCASGEVLVDISHHGQVVVSLGSGGELDAASLKAWC